MTWLRLLLACALAVAGIALAWPTAVVTAASGITWAQLLAPLGKGTDAGGGFAFEQPRRGRESDLVIMAHRAAGAARVEVHVVDRGQWTDTLETPSFGVAYETPQSSATAAEALVVTRAVWTAIRANDPGGLTVDAVPLTPGAGDVPQGERPLLHLSAARCALVMAALAVATGLLTTVRSGALLSATWLLGLGLLLRAPRLGLPFAIDQDVQRMFTGHLPVVAILTGQGLDDRHPPLYFLVLHVAQWAGQSEAIGRAPAVLAGALLGPAVIAGAWIAARARGSQVAMAALAATVAPELVRRSREVSEIPLFGLIAIGLCASYAATITRRDGRRGQAIAWSAALALYTYYLAPLVLAGSIALGWVGRRTARPAFHAAVLGTLVGAPALVLELRIITRDEGARQAARAHPAFAWGQHGVLGMARELAQLSKDTLGVTLLALLGTVAVVALARRRAAVLVPIGALVATFVGIALVSPVARVQPYYLTAVLPLAFLALAVGLPRAGVGAWLGAIVVAVGVVGSAVVNERSLEDLYVRAPDECMSEVARIVDTRPERRVLLSVDYDATLLAYDLARLHDVPMDWARMHHEAEEIRLDGLPQVLVPLLRVHAPGDDPEGTATARLENLTDREDVLVVARRNLGLSALEVALAGCDLLFDGGSSRLLHCPRR